MIRLSTKLMKSVDRVVGWPLCLALSLVSRLLDCCRPPAARQKILLIKFFGMGSLLLASPLFRALRGEPSTTRLGILTFESNRQLLERLGCFDDIYTLRHERLGAFITDFMSGLWRIRAAGYDVTIDMEFFARFTAICAWLSGARTRIGYHLRQVSRGSLFTHHVHYNPHRHITEVYAALAAPLAIKVADTTATPPTVSDADVAAAAALLRDAGRSATDRYICVNVNASDLCLERRWPAASFRQLIERLLADTEVTIGFIGSPADRAYVDQLLAGLSASPRLLNLAGKTDLGCLLGLLTGAALVITNDSGPLHLATALGRPTVSFFGPESPVLFGPPANQGHLVFYLGVYCSPCLNAFNAKSAPCAGDNLCLKQLAPETVLAQIRQLHPTLFRPDRQGRDSPGVVALDDQPSAGPSNGAQEPPEASASRISI